MAGLFGFGVKFFLFFFKSFVGDETLAFLRRGAKPSGFIALAEVGMFDVAEEKKTCRERAQKRFQIKMSFKDVCDTDAGI